MKREQTLETVLVIAAGLLVVYFFAGYHYIPFIVFALIVIGVFVKPVANLIAEYWMKLAHILGTISSTVLLSLVFFLVLTPVAWFNKRISKDSMALKRNKTRTTMYFNRNAHLYSRKDFENPW